MFFQQLINGITIGSTYALVSIGFTMVFGVLELTNFANGSLYMLGAYLSLMLYSATGMNAFLAFFISIILTGGVGYLLDRLALRRLRNKKAPKLTGLITTLMEHKRDIHIRPTFSLTGQPPRMCRSCWDILM